MHLKLQDTDSLVLLEGCFTFEIGSNGLSRNVDDYESTLRNIPEKRQPHLQRGESLSSRMRRSSACNRTVPY